MEHERLCLAVKDLKDVMARLRRECPFDREQTHESLRRYLIEETAEVLEALDGGDLGALREELGDLLFQIWFQAEIAAEQGPAGFGLEDVLEGIALKLRRRHPHVFGAARFATVDEVRRSWEAIKAAEGRAGRMQGLPAELSALQLAQTIQEKAAGAGFDWERADDVLAKVREEVEELAAEVEAGRMERQVAEFGDLLFSLVNCARHLRINAEDALRLAARRFRRRFETMEDLARQSGRALDDSSLAELEDLWRAAKQAESTDGAPPA